MFDKEIEEFFNDKKEQETTNIKLLVELNLNTTLDIPELIFSKPIKKVQPKVTIINRTNNKRNKHKVF